MQMVAAVSERSRDGKSVAYTEIDKGNEYSNNFITYVQPIFNDTC